MRRLGLVLLAGVLTAGCASLPTDGPVRVGERQEPSTSAAPFDFNPPGPRAGATPEQVASGFLSALQATPVSTRVAAQYLTPAAAETWQPGRRTLVYQTQRLVTGVDAVTVELGGTYALDESGRWQGATPGGRQQLRLRMVKAEGEWRLANPPDAMVIPQAHFQSRYRAYSLYFFDRTASTLVPEPVYLPWGVQAPTLLVAGLLAGPAAPAAVQTFIPPGTSMGVGVPVSEEGIAEVPLSPEMEVLAPDERTLALAQLTWTLRQVPEIRRLEVTVDGVALELPGGRTSLEVDGSSAYSPAVSTASTDLFGVRGREIRQLVGDTELVAATVPESGPGAVTGIRSLGVSMTGQRFAVVDDAGTRVVVLGRTEDEGSAAETLMFGTDLLRPLWDLTDRLWLVDSTASGPVVTLAHQGRLRRLPAPGLEGSRVVAASLSRDGTRLAWVVEGERRQQLLVSRVVRRPQGAPDKLSRAVPVPTGTPWRGVRSLGWRGPSTLAALTTPDPGTTEVLLAEVDGSFAFEALQSSVDLLFEPGRDLAASPGGPLALIVATRQGRLHALDLDGRWDLDVVARGLRHPTFAG